jgi:CheY-like chemotaxis protein
LENSLKTLNSRLIEKHNATRSGATVLIVDDSEADVFFLVKAMTASNVKNPIFVVRSGKEALDYLKGEGEFANRTRFPFPGIVFLDLRMSPIDGFQILWWKTRHQEFKKTLFVALSNFDSPAAINEAYAAGANTFLAKPLNSEDVRNIVEAFQVYWDCDTRAQSSGK